MLRSASNCNTTFVMTLAMKNGHELEMWEEPVYIWHTQSTTTKESVVEKRPNISVALQ